MNRSKICILKHTGEISHTIIFSKQEDAVFDVNVFTSEKTYYTDAKIHPDDSIRTIKMKLLYELHKGANANDIQLRPSYEEIYLYAFVKETTTTLKLFDALKPEDSNSHISRHLIRQIIEGHPDEKTILQRLPAGEKIPYGEFESILSEENIEISVKTPLGITFAGGYRDTTFEADPFNVDKYRAYTSEYNNLHYLDDSLLLNHGILIDNTIYVCLANNVYEHTGKESEEYIARYYFPGLYKEGIQSKETLIEKRGKLVKSTQKLLSDERAQYYESISTFYAISESDDGGEPLKYISQGIQNITLRLRNQYSHHTNLEMLFKNMHCSKEIPYIKFNPGNRREKLYRFYFEKTTRTGKKVPYLARSHIMKMAKETGRGQQISAYLEGAILQLNGRKRVLSNCYLHFELNGDVQLQMTFYSAIDERMLDEIIREQILPYFSIIGRDIRETGFKMPEYNGLRDIANTKVVNMKYVCKTAATKETTWETIPCIYSICTLNTDVPGEPLIVRLKRVENFKEMDAANILIAELYGQVQYGELALEDIANELVSRGLSEDENSARMTIAGFLATINEMNGEIVEKPGFPLEMSLNRVEKTIEISVSEMTSIFYLDTVTVYINAILKLTQVYKDSNPLLKQLKKLCKKAIKFREPEPEKGQEDTTTTRLFKEATAVKEGPLKLSSFAKDDDFFAQFESDDDEEYRERKRDDEVIMQNIEEDEETANNLLDELRKNTQTISKPIMFDFEEEEEQGQGEDEEKEELQKKQKEREEEKGEREEEKKEKDSEVPITRPGPIVFDFDDEEEEETEYDGGGKKKGKEVAATKESSTLAKGLSVTKDLTKGPDTEELSSNSTPRRQDKSVRMFKTGFVPDGESIVPNPLRTELGKRDPVLFTSKPSGNFKSFATSCQPISRHPVILNHEEMDRTDKSAYTYSVKYGSDPKNPNYFICPKFWCFLTNSAISEDDVKAGKCGSIIPKEAKVIPKGAYVYQLHDESYIPGFMENKLANGKCLPCCFKKTWDNKTQTDIRNRCESQIMETAQEQDSDGEDKEDKDEGEHKGDDKKGKPKQRKPKQSKPAKSLQYIISLDTYPIPQNRWGFLPIPVQLFFQIDYRPSLDPNNPALLKPDQQIFLRYGVEQPPDQSFLGCFADIYARRQGLDKVPTVDEFRKILGEVINLDIFVKAHNGSLLSAFFPRNTMSSHQKRPKMSSDVRAKYKDTEFAISLDVKDKANKRHLDDAILAYENFIAFLMDKNVKIDHEYLWDFVCDDNKRLIQKGLNLVILEIKANDIIDRIELVCPTNLYSRNQYDFAKDTVILLKHDNFYEPIYMYESKASGSPKVTPFYAMNKVPGSISDMLRRVEDATRKNCPGLPSLPKIYRFLNPVPIQKLMGSLIKIKAKVETQVVNYQGKTIGLMVVENGVPGAIYVPCAPSARLKLPIKYMDSSSIPKEYEKTVEQLTRISNTAKIPCKPVWKIKESGMVVGFLTETNQFVPIKPNEDIIMDGMQTYEGVDVFDADKTNASKYKDDKTRVKMTKYIVLESQFYHAFRNRIRTLLNKFENKKLKNEIRKISEDKTLIYKQKVEQIEVLIRRLIKGYIVFIEIGEPVLMDMAEVNECDTAADEGPYCVLKENGVAQLGIPKQHLISEYDNEKIYVGRIADELVRNDRVKSIMYDVENRLNSKTTEYRIKEDEFILAQSALTTEYFAELDSTANTNPYAKNTNYELANPSISVVYPNEKIPLSEQYKPTEELNELGEGVGEGEDGRKECLVRVSNIIGNQKQVWDRIFSEDAREYIYRDVANCTFQPIIRIVESHLGEVWTETDIKNKLSAAYLKLFEKDPSNMFKIAKIQKEQGKTKMFDKFLKFKGEATPEEFQNIVIGGTYHLTDMDIWVLANEYNLPIVVFNANGLKGFFPKVDDTATSNVNTQWIKMGGNKTDAYHFIRSKIRVAKSSYANHVYEYNLIVPAVKLSRTKEFEDMVIDSVRSDRLNTAKLEDALERFFE